MAYEVETKVLNVDAEKIETSLKELGAKKVLDTRLVVDWFRQKGLIMGQETWYLRIRTNSEGASEITWKGKSKVLGNSRRHKEINISVEDPQIMSSFLEAVGLERYAHQEKDRKSWIYKDWRFDLDTYPKMQPYLEIEGKNEKHIQEAIKILNLGNNQTSSEGERILIEEQFKLNWCEMRFYSDQYRKILSRKNKKGF